MEKLIEEIDTWLARPVYWAGVELYQKYGRNGWLKDYLAGGAEEYRRALLQEELEELRATSAAALAALEEARPQRLTDEKQEAGLLMDRRTALKERARVLVEQGATGGVELAEIATEIKEEINRRLDDIFGLEVFWKANGYVPETVEVAVMDLAGLIQRRNTLRSYVSRGKNAVKVAGWKNELFEIQKKIDAIQG